MTGVETYCKKLGRNPKEEFLTQIFSCLMLKDDVFRKAFLDKLEIPDVGWKFKAESNVRSGNDKGEIDVLGTAEKAILIIENKLGAEISLKQPEIYARIFESNSLAEKYIVVLTKFSGLIPFWNSYEGSIKSCIINALKKHIDTALGNEQYVCNHIYWHEVYDLLKKHFSDKKMQKHLLEFFESETLDQSWHQDMGCAFWRREFIKEYNKFAKQNGLPEKIVPEPLKKNRKPNIQLISLQGEGNYFGGARIQGARCAETYNNDSLLQININGVKARDLSDYIDDPARCISESADLILKAYGKK